MSSGTPSAPTPQALPAAPWRDRKRLLWLLSTLMPAFVAMHLWKVLQGGSAWWLWIFPLWLHVLVPLLDAWLGEDTRNPAESAVAALEQERWYRVLVALYVPSQWLVTVLGAWVVASQPLSIFGWLGLVLSVGGINGIGINAAHELGHKRVVWEQWLSKLALAPVAYGHFLVEHNRGHHARVATPPDPASARMGESFWAFLPRTVLGSLSSAWALEALRLEYIGRSRWSLANLNLQGWLMTALLFSGLTWQFGWAVLPFLVLQALYGISLLEVVNYIEHYGLLRETGPNGRPVRCTHQHSWNSSHLVSNLLLFHLQRHSDHHAHPARRYQALRHFADSPQLPSGYAALICLAYVPAVWRWVMDPRVMAHYGGDIQRANLHPQQRDRLIRRWAR